MGRRRAGLNLVQPKFNGYVMGNCEHLVIRESVYVKCEIGWSRLGWLRRWHINRVKVRTQRLENFVLPRGQNMLIVGEKPSWQRERLMHWEDSHCIWKIERWFIFFKDCPDNICHPTWSFTVQPWHIHANWCLFLHILKPCQALRQLKPIE